MANLYAFVLYSKYKCMIRYNYLQICVHSPLHLAGGWNGGGPLGPLSGWG